jgi:hypothetical protein
LAEAVRRLIANVGSRCELPGSSEGERGIADVKVSELRTGFVDSGDDEEADDAPQLQKSSRKKIPRDVVTMRQT